MTEGLAVDFGPLKNLIGDWKGDKGTDVAPEPDGSETSPYYETITVTPVGSVTNAEEQVLAALHYHQIVYRKSNDEAFHNQTGYWMWDAATGTVMHSFTIPRAVSLLAGGLYKGETDADGRVALKVSAGIDDPAWGIVQSPFMADNARTVSFRQQLFIGRDSLSYDETTILDIYGQRFEHTDCSALVRD